MPTRQMERAMAIWREAERLLAVLPEHSHEAVDVRRALAEARSAYVALSTFERGQRRTDGPLYRNDQ